MRVFQRYFFYRAILVTLFCVTTSGLFGAVAITPTVTLGSCPNSASITVTATGTTGSVFYAIKNIADATFPTQQSSNVFLNLASGTYVVAVYDGSGTTISSPIAVSNPAYTSMAVTNTTIGNNGATGCLDDGSIDMSITGGNAPYTYHLKGGPTSSPDVVTNTKAVQFTKLATGVYSIDIIDGCGHAITKSGISVVSRYNLSGITLGSLDGMGGATASAAGGCDLSISFSTSNISLKDVSNNIIFDRNGTRVPTGYPIAVRVEYPSGSGNYTPWQSVFSSFALPGYLPDGSKYRVEMRHPCNPTNVVVSPDYSIPYPFASRSGYCAPSIIRVISGYNCGDVTITLVNKANPAITRTYIWSDNNSSYTLDLSGLASGSYSVAITVAGQTYSTTDISTVTTTAVSVAAIYNYYGTAGCDFTIGGLRVYSIPTNNAIPITFTLLPGSTVSDRPPVTVSQDTNPLWNDLPPGGYQVEVKFGDCNTIVKNVSIAIPYSGFQADNLSYVPGSSCGKYKITGKGWYLAPDNTVFSGATLYAVKLFNAAGVAITGTGVTTTANSNTDFTLGYEVSPGTYKVSFTNQIHSQGYCYYVDKYITIPAYVPLAVDVAHSGGIVCSGGVGELHIEIAAGTGSGSAVTYRVKPQGSPDGSYTSWQSSPDFPNLPAGSYTVQVNDACGYSVSQNLSLVTSSHESSVRIAGSDIVSGIANVCVGSSITMNLDIIGRATDIRWKKPDGTEMAESAYTIFPIAATDAGKYYVLYNAGGCAHKDSVVLTINPKPEFSFDNATICASTTIDLAALPLVDGDTSGLAFTYKTDSDIELGSSVVSAAGTYYIIGTTTFGCADTSVVTISVNPLPVPSITGNTSVLAYATGIMYTTEAGMFDYTWSVSGGTISSGGTATDNTVTISWGATGDGTVTVSYTNANECRAATASVQNVTINPAALTLELAVGNIQEGDPAITVTVCMAELTAAPVGGLIVNLASGSGTIAGAIDYSLTGGGISGVQLPATIVIPEGTRCATFNLSAPLDKILEGDQLLVIEVSATGFTGDDGSLTIADRTPGGIVVRKEGFDASEPATSATFRLGFEDEEVSCTKDVVVNFALTGEAQEGIDYEAVIPHSITIPAGEKGVLLPIVVKNNQAVEGSRVIIITITAANKQP